MIEMKHKHHLPEDLSFTTDDIARGKDAKLVNMPSDKFDGVISDEFAKSVGLVPGIGIIAHIDMEMGRLLAERIHEKDFGPILIIGHEVSDTRDIFRPTNTPLMYLNENICDEDKRSSALDEFLSPTQKREPKHQTYKKNYKFHR